MLKNKYALILIATTLLSSCYYDKQDELYPRVLVNDTCDTTVTISYQNHINPIMNTSCGATDNNCHSSANTTSLIPLDNYLNLFDVVSDGSLMGSILHTSGYKPMPEGGGKLDDCSIAKIQIWINNNAPNN